MKMKTGLIFLSLPALICTKVVQTLLQHHSKWRIAVLKI